MYSGLTDREREEVKSYVYPVCCGYYLFWLTNPVKRERYNMCAIENVSVPAATGDRGYLAAIEADGHLVRDLWL